MKILWFSDYIGNQINIYFYILSLLSTVHREPQYQLLIFDFFIWLFFSTDWPKNFSRVDMRTMEFNSGALRGIWQDHADFNPETTSIYLWLTRFQFWHYLFVADQFSILKLNLFVADQISILELNLFVADQISILELNLFVADQTSILKLNLRLTRFQSLNLICLWLTRFQSWN